MANTKTLQDLRNIAYGILKTTEAASAYPTVLMDAFINKAQNDICLGNLTNLKTEEKLLKPTLSFLNKEAFYTSVQPSTLASAIVIGATTISIASTTYYSTTGAIWVDGMIVTYTGKTSTTFTGCSGVIANMSAGAKIYPLYVLPTDFAQMTSAYYIPSSGGVQAKMVPIDYRDFKESYVNQTVYAVQRIDNTLYRGEVYYTIVNGAYFLTFTPANGNNIRFEYQKLPTTLSATTDIATIPDTYVLNTVPYIAVSEMLFNRGEPDLGIELNNFGYKNTKTMYAFYTSQLTELNYNQRIRTSKDGIVNI